MHFSLWYNMWRKVKVAHLCLFADPMDYTIHEILLVVIPFSRGYFQTRDGTPVSCISGRFFTSSATR